MALTIGVHNKGVVSSATTCTSTAIDTQASGSGLVVFFFYSGTLDGTPIQDNKGNTASFSQIGTELTLTGAAMRAYYVPSVIGGSGHTVTVTVTAANPITMFVVEVKTTNGNGITLEAQDRAVDLGTPYDSPGVANTTADAVYVGATICLGPAGTQDHTSGNSFLEQDEEQDANNFYNGISMTQLVANAATRNTSVTITTAVDEAGCWLAAFAEAAALGPVKPLPPPTTFVGQPRENRKRRAA